MSKTIKNLVAANPEKFSEYWNEDHNERGLDYWVTCKEPYFNPMTECQTLHEYTVNDMLKAMRGVRKGVFNGHSWEEVYLPPTPKGKLPMAAKEDV
jgi:hypothetical protein